MAKIHVLSSETIDKIAAGEVVERPLSIVKELVENSIDAGSTSITVEIKEGGISFIRVTDNGCGISRDDIETAFLRHATSKINKSSDLNSIESLGFRGEALSSIAAVSQVELMTKTSESLVGCRFAIEGGAASDISEVGLPTGTTIIVRNLFFNVPVRRKFLKTPATEGSYIGEILEKLALSRPDISFKFVNGHDTKFQTSGNGDLKEVIYRLFGREVSEKLLPVDYSEYGMSFKGFVGRPELNRSTRSYEIFFVNGRSVKTDLLFKAVEDASSEYLMQHKYPFCVVSIDISPDEIDVNVHPSKLEIRFIQRELFYQALVSAVQKAFEKRELIKDISFTEKEDSKEDSRLRKLLFKDAPEPFEANHSCGKIEDDEVVPKTNKSFVLFDDDDDGIVAKYNETDLEEISGNDELSGIVATAEPSESSESSEEKGLTNTQSDAVIAVAEQLSIDESLFLSQSAKKNHRIIGQYLDTYWLVEFDRKLFIIDQHAAHEKVNYERFVARFKNNLDECPSQFIDPAIIITLNQRTMNTYMMNKEFFDLLGFETENYGGNEIALRSVPLDLYGAEPARLFQDILDEMTEHPVKGTPEIVRNKIASMACKAAVKGNMRLSHVEAEALIDELLTLDNPYNCPHGRPTIISLSQSEIEKKFKRIID